MIDLAPDIAGALFWILAVMVVVAPRRWAILAFLVVVQVDLSGPGWASTSAVGLENGIKVLVLPLILLLRVGPWPLPGQLSRALKLWLAFTAYVAVASLWSPFPVSAVKMVVYLVSYAIVFLVFAEAWRQELLDTTQIVAAVWLSLLLATIQTYVLGNAFGSPPKLIIEQARFTTFAPPQSYAAFLVSAAALLLFIPRTTPGRMYTALIAGTGAGIVVGLVLVGSRYVAVGTVALFIIAGGIKLWSQLQQRRVSRYSVVRGVAVGGISLVILIGSVTAVAPDNRIFALRRLVSHGHLNPSAIGTFEWRLGAYQTALDQIRDRGLLANVVGSGTSSGAQAILAFNPTAFPADTIDANRALHNEFLRAFYEWGLIGEALFLAFWTVLIIGLFRRTQRDGLDRTKVFWGLLPTLGLGLLLENVLAGSGTPVGTGFTLVLTYAAAATAPVGQRTEANNAYPDRAQLLPSAGR